MTNEIQDLYGPELTDDRPSWDAYHMATAQMISERASCRKRLKVGAVVVKGKRQIATGYNGSPPGEDTCIEKGCLLLPGQPRSCKRVIHAEHNALLQHENKDIYQGATIYVNYYPCISCMGEIAAAGISRIVYWKKRDKDKFKHKHQETSEIADMEGIELEELSQDNKIAIIKLLKDKYELLFKDID